MTKTVYYLTGMNGRLATGLGEALLSRGVDVTGRELVDDFRNFTFQDQIDTVAEDLKNHFWTEDSYVIGSSFGAYLFLHAQAKLMKPYVGNVILLSPIVGEFANEDTLMNFIPPRPNALFDLAKTGKFPTPIKCEIHVGSEDWQSIPSNVQSFGELVGIKVHVVAKAGHMLPKDYVGKLLDKWLA
jgi:predicted alpha/beta hydrolase family esterase